MKLRTIIISLALIFLSGILSANLRKELNDIESQFNIGNLDAVAGNLMSLKPLNDEERAFALFYTAQIDKNTTSAKVSYNQLATQYPTTRYGQKGMLELAKIHILARQIDSAIGLLRRITNPDLPDKSYWQAVCSFQKSDWQTTIDHAENFIRLAPQSHLIEDGYYLIANSFLHQNKAHSAITSLNKLKSLKNLPSDQQHFYYLLGYAYEQNKSIRDAVLQYKEGYLLNKYSQLAYLIEDRLFELRKAYGNSVDVSFLYPYVDLSLHEISHVETQDPASGPAPPSLLEKLPDTPMKVSARPEGDFFIQAGRFSSEANAANLVMRIRQLEIHAVYYESMHNDKMTWVVLSGPYANQQEAIFSHAKLRENEIDCFVTRN